MASYKLNHLKSYSQNVTACNLTTFRVPSVVCLPLVVKHCFRRVKEVETDVSAMTCLHLLTTYSTDQLVVHFKRDSFFALINYSKCSKETKLYSRRARRINL